MLDNRSGRWPFDVRVAAPTDQMLDIAGRHVLSTEGVGAHGVVADAATQCRCHSENCVRPDSDAVSELTAGVWRAANVLSSLMTRLVLTDVGLTWSQWEILRFVCEHSVCTVDACGRQLGIEPIRVVQAAVALSRRGLVYLRLSRGAVPAVIAATDRGHDIVPGVQHQIAELESVLLCPLRPAHVWAVEAVLARVATRARTAADAPCHCELHA